MMGGELGVQAHVLQVTFDVGGGQGPEHARRGLGHFHVDLLAGLVPACAERSRETRVRQTRSWLVFLSTVGLRLASMASKSVGPLYHDMLSLLLYMFSVHIRCLALHL